MFCPFFQYCRQVAVPVGGESSHMFSLSDTAVSAVFPANPLINPYYFPVGRLPRTAETTAYPQGNYYIVKPGDTLYSICDFFRVDADALMEANPCMNPDGLLAGESLCIPKSWNLYSNPIYNVTFMYPLRWSRVNDERYEGMNGFFQVSAIASESPLEEICKNEAFHKLKPYGSNPTIKHYVFKGQPACFIWPSEDQPQEMKEQSALIIKYPRPVAIKGQFYNYFMLWSDKRHIRKIAESLSFLVI